MNVEEWRPIPGFDGYMASSLGRVRSHRIAADGRLLTQHLNARTGYYITGPSVNGRQRSRPVHVLVTLAFHGPRPEGAVVRHLDGTRTNNVPENLRWGTRSENTQDMLRHGTGPKKWSMGRDACQRGHAFTLENTRVNEKRQLWICRQCDRELTAARRARRRLEIAAARVEVAA